MCTFLADLPPRKQPGHVLILANHYLRDEKNRRLSRQRRQAGGEALQGYGFRRTCADGCRGQLDKGFHREGIVTMWLDVQIVLEHCLAKTSGQC